MAIISVDQAFQLARVYHRSGQVPLAEKLYRQVLTAQPQHVEAMHQLGLIALASGRHEEAAQMISGAIARDPGNGTYYSELGLVYRQLGRMDEAVGYLGRATALSPYEHLFHLHLGETLLQMSRFEGAIASFRRALELRADIPEAHNNLGTALAQLGRWDEAMTSHRCALGWRPNFADAHNNLGIDYLETGQPAEAMTHFQRALELQPDMIESLLNMARAWIAQGRFEEALAPHRQAVAIRPDSAQAHHHLGHVLLLLRRYAEGWPEYEWRWLNPAAATIHRNLEAPRWHGEAAPEKSVLLHCEQGFGDAIQFLRYVPLVRERATPERLILECPPGLERLLASQGDPDLKIVSRRPGGELKLPSSYLHCPLLSLPLALGVFDPLPMAGPYLKADSVLENAWHERLGPPAFRVGLAWAGSADHLHDHQRSIAFEKLQPLLAVENVRFYSLQVDQGDGRAASHEKSGLVDLTAQITDFADTAALMTHLDLIISVDTAAAHLAGALGRKVWTLLPFVPDWRWGLEREDTPWYPTMRLFRQPAVGDWEAVIRRVAEELPSAARSKTAG
ncbi:MAG TPA: tetratricopeptide repeat protein [Chthoniobacter sp.]|jgi:tetratricopeptide (TPR) repeat protein